MNSAQYDKFPEDYHLWNEARKRAWITMRLKDVRAEEENLKKISRELAQNGIFDKSKIDERPDELK